MCDSGEQCDREWVEVKFFQDVVNQIGPSAVLVDMIEGVGCSLRWQCGDVEDLAIGRDGGDAGSDAKINVVEPTQFLHHGIDLLSACPLRVENRLRIVKNYDHIP